MMMRRGKRQSYTTDGASFADRAVGSWRVQEYNGSDIPISDDALARLLGHIVSEPWNPILHGLLGQMRKQRKEYDEACAAWYRAIDCWHGRDNGAIASLKESIGEIQALVGRADVAFREYGEAAEAYHRASSAAAPGIVRDNYISREAYCLIQIGRTEDAQCLLQQLREGPNQGVFAAVIAEMERAMSSPSD